MNFRQTFREACYVHRYLFMAGAAYALIVLAQAWYLHVPPDQLMTIPEKTAASFLSYILCFFLIFIWFGGRAAFRALREPGKTFSKAVTYYLQDYDRYWNSKLPAYSIPAFLATTSLNFFFVQKCLIRFLVPYRSVNWDPLFVKLDRLLFLGHAPDAVVIKLVNGLHLLRLMDYTYVGWFVLMLLVPGYAILMDTDFYRRMRFLWCYFLYWVVLGSAMAMALSSVGPAYFGHFYPDLPDPYVALNANLDAVNANHDVLMIEYGVRPLLGWSTGEKMVDENAIAAMPSMHVGICFLIAMYMIALSRSLRWPMAVLLAVVYIGSIYFGMHYAIDGVVAVAVGWPIWAWSDWVVRKLHPKPEKLLPDGN